MLYDLRDMICLQLKDSDERYNLGKINNMSKLILKLVIPNHIENLEIRGVPLGY